MRGRVDPARIVRRPPLKHVAVDGASPIAGGRAPRGGERHVAGRGHRRGRRAGWRRRRLPGRCQVSAAAVRPGHRAGGQPVANLGGRVGAEGDSVGWPGYCRAGLHARRAAVLHLEVVHCQAAHLGWLAFFEEVEPVREGQRVGERGAGRRPGRIEGERSRHGGIGRRACALAFAVAVAVGHVRAQIRPLVGAQRSEGCRGCAADMGPRASRARRG